jgi:hypothetical protein
MSELFYSQEQYDEHQDELAGDGFSNELQRASFAARLENPPRNDRALAERLTLAGKHVVVMSAPYECRITSAVIGEDFVVVAFYDNKDDAEGHAWSLHERVCDDASAYVYRALPPEPAAPGPVIEDECPF